ncbi:MAG: hypothetical protein LBM04_00215 [Opitutaceae bacterium]|nr:hypothetical protein [Opitutaceae bacterium]
MRKPASPNAAILSGAARPAGKSAATGRQRDRQGDVSEMQLDKCDASSELQDDAPEMQRIASG